MNGAVCVYGGGGDLVYQSGDRNWVVQREQLLAWASARHSETVPQDSPQKDSTPHISKHKGRHWNSEAQCQVPRLITFRTRIELLKARKHASDTETEIKCSQRHCRMSVQPFPVYRWFIVIYFPWFTLFTDPNVLNISKHFYTCTLKSLWPDIYICL